MQTSITLVITVY